MGRKSAKQKHLANASSNRWHQSTGSYTSSMFTYIIKTVSTSAMATDSSPPAPSSKASSICRTPTVNLMSSQCSAGSRASSPTLELSSLDFSGLTSNSEAAINKSSKQGCKKHVNTAYNINHYSPASPKYNVLLVLKTLH